MSRLVILPSTGCDSVGTFTIDNEKTGGFDDTNVVAFANGSEVAGRRYEIRGVDKAETTRFVSSVRWSTSQAPSLLHR